MENNVKNLQKRQEILKIIEKLPGPARKSKYLELLYQYSEMFGREVKQISVNNYTKDTLFFDATCVRLFLYKSHSL